MKDFIAECRDMMVDGHDVAKLQARLTAENPEKTLVVPGLAKPKGAEGAAVQAPKLLGPDGKELPTDARGRLIAPAPVETRQQRRLKQRQREKAVRREKTEMERLRIRTNRTSNDGVIRMVLSKEEVRDIREAAARREAELANPKAKFTGR